MNAAQHVRVISVSDGADVIPPRPGDWPHFSPNGRWLAYQAAPAKDSEPAVCLASIEDPNQVFVVADGYQLPRFDFHSPPQRPVWSPDGRYLIVLDDESLPYVVEARSDAVPVPIWDRPAENLNWSPNGRVIAVNGPAFQETPDAPSVWTLDPSGEGWGRPGGTGRRPLWYRYDLITCLDSESQIQTTNVATALGRVLAEGSFPALSPAGRRLAYVSNGGVNGQAVNLFLLDLTTDETRQLTEFDSTFFMETPTWSPDGALIAFFVGGPDLENGLYVVNPDAADSIRLLYSAVDSHVWSPTWSPDGTQIVFDLGGGHD